jgi:hypothetical protein
MSKKEKQAATVKKGTVRSAKPKSDLLDRMNAWLEKNDRKMFFLVLLLSTVFSLLLFDAKVSDGGDDSSYIERAWSFVHEGKYPYFQGPGYPVMLSLVLRVFGLNVPALKFFSFFCQLGFVFFTYKAFVKRIPYVVLYALLAFISVNYYIQYYSSQTFTETFFLFLQSICIYVTFRIIDSIDPAEGWMDSLKKNYLKWLLFGALFVFLSISKSIGFVTILAVAGYFILKKNYRQAVYALVAFFLIRFIYQQITGLAFGPNDTNQLELMLRKELYKPELGHEDFGGMIDRFFGNFNTYMSLHIYRIMKLRSDHYEITSIIPQLSYITALVMGIFTFLSYRKNKFTFFTNIYVIILCAGIFVGVQVLNMQDRLIIIAMPFIFLLFFYGFYELVKRYASLQVVFVLFAAIMLLVNVKYSLVDRVIGEKKITALKKNLAGDIYYGYTPDWENFLKMSKYCADSLPADAQVISRKPAMSFLYGNGKKFAGQFIVTSENPDTVLADWKKRNVDYVILASLRMNPKKNNGAYINTIHRMIVPVYQKYPEKIQLVKSFGTTEKCELYRITY